MQDFEIWKNRITHAIDKSIGKIMKLKISSYEDFKQDQSYKFWRFLRLREF